MKEGARKEKAGTGLPVRGVLSTPPTRIWPDGLIHHGFRAALLLGLAVLFAVLFPPDPAADVGETPVGTVAEEEVIARVDFAVPLSASELREARTEARASVPPTFDVRPLAPDSMAARISRFLDQVQAAALSEDPVPAVRRTLAGVSINVTEQEAEQLIDSETFEAVRSTAERAALQLLPEGVAESTDLAEAGPIGRVTVRDPGAGAGRSVAVEDILSATEFIEEATTLLPPGTSPDVEQVLRLLLIQYLEFSYRLNVQATEQGRASAAGAVPTEKQEVVEGEAIVRANQRITEDIQERLDAYRAELRLSGLDGERGTMAGLPALVGQVLLNLLLLGTFGVLVFFFRAPVYTRARWIFLVAALIGVYAGGAKMVVVYGWPMVALPIAFVTLSLAILWDGRMALVLVLSLAALTSVQPGMIGAASLVPTAVGGATAALMVRAVRRRSQAWIFIAAIGAAYAASLLALGLVNGFGGSEQVVDQVIALSANTIFATLLAMGFLPVFEIFTGITTDQTLLEWADPNRPLLKQLSMEAPGTYAHTINVANLGEAGAAAIGANGLLCRVGLYYHDVGKMLKPHYFVENQPDGRNPHDKLRPDTSAAIVKEHVTEGLRLVREAKVPDVVAAFVGEHHGTQRIGFFWDAAVEEFGSDKLDISDFTYPGPRPQSRETAIAMLADSVESATRALKDPTRERISDLIDSVVQSKIAAGQLDEAPITLRELTLIKEQFTKVLGGVYHSRIDYPETRHLTESPTPEAVAAAADDAVPAAPSPRRRRSTSSDESQLLLVEDDDVPAASDEGEEEPS